MWNPFTLHFETHLWLACSISPLGYVFALWCLVAQRLTNHVLLVATQILSVPRFDIWRAVHRSTLRAFVVPAFCFTEFSSCPNPSSTLEMNSSRCQRVRTERGHQGSWHLVCLDHKAWAAQERSPTNGRSKDASRQHQESGRELPQRSRSPDAQACWCVVFCQVCRVVSICNRLEGVFVRARV